MPISKKIINEIEKMDETDEMKELMTDILVLEDNGVKRWTNDYDKMIDEFIKIYRSNSGDKR